MAQNSKHWRLWANWKPWGAGCGTCMEVISWIWPSSFQSWLWKIQLSPLLGSVDVFGGVCAISFRCAWTCCGGAVGHMGQHLLQAAVSFTGGFALSLSKGTGQLSRACSCHGFPGPAPAPSLTMRHFIRGSTTPFGNQVLFHLPQLLHH